MTVDEALWAVVYESTGAYSEYAKTYARGMLILSDSHARRTQCAYVLSNLQNWRGERAREVKKVLKEVLK